MDVGTLLRRLPMRQRRRSRPRPDRSLTLTPILLDCPECRHRTYADYKNYRTISTLDSVFRLTLTIRRCPNPECSRFLRPYRPEAESHFALPYHEFGLDVMALVGRLRYAEHRSIPEIYRELTRRGIVLAERTVTNLLDRYDELRGEIRCRFVFWGKNDEPTPNFRTCWGKNDELTLNFIS